jgi:mannose/fructose/N-acetylgalactosamine-specific phosphotransferase system component IID
VGVGVAVEVTGGVGDVVLVGVVVPVGEGVVEGMSMATTGETISALIPGFLSRRVQALAARMMKTARQNLS